MTKEEIVLETIEYYKTHNRGINEEGCTYLNDNGDMCAIGSCMTTEYREVYKNNTEYTVNVLNSKHGIDNILQEEYKGHPLEFWKKLQRLHDNNMNWDGNNLSQKGIENARSLFGITL